MDLFNSFFSELLNKYGLYTTIGVIVMLYVLRDLWTRHGSRLFGRKKVHLKDHPAFKKFDMMIEHTLVNDFHCDCPIRKALYRDIQRERTKCFKKRLLEFVDTDLNSKDEYPTGYDFYLKVVSVIDEANIQSKKNLIADGVPEFMLDRHEGHTIQLRQNFDDMIKAATQ